MVLLWDHLLTLDDEIIYIWRQKKGPLIWLFFLNRYLTPLGFIVNLLAYFGIMRTPARCAHFVRYEGAMTVIGINTSALMMLLRVYAMHSSKRGIVASVAVVFVLELGTNAWLLANGIPVPRAPQFKGSACTMIFDTNRVPAGVAAASAWLPLLYDTIVLGLTVQRAYSDIRHPTVGRITRILLKEGVWYYSVIFCITLVLTLMIVLAPRGIQNATAQYVQLVGADSV
ncbi:hypothetical protein C8Q74DRAFT_1272497 [Fomes fomentarius]|nr:hypothetical protein C8Q74DRAFT_1272497 [Fomes fomentarius]